MNNENYWFPWYPIHFKRDTMHLPAALRGMYRDLIDFYMETGKPLPDNEIALSRIVSVSIDEWKMATAILRPFFRHDSGHLFHKKCDEILAEQAARSRKQAEKGKKGAISRWSEKQQQNSSGYSQAMAQAMPGDATRQRQDSKKESKPPTPLEENLPGFELPDWIPVLEWNLFLEMRKRQRVQNTEKAIELIIKKLDSFRREGHSVKEIIEEAIEKSWRSVYAPKGNKNQGKPRYSETKTNVKTL